MTITSPGITVTVKSHAPLDQVTTCAEQLHQRTAQRWADGRRPSGFAGETP
ncbi:hypothetical protein ACGFI9_12195 [Micromonospora sp. NPDC048930]|uniref:hypothetical protein n=1 Tax=Micromonospora sp. NPDC048930 TaxID=3364261 RepID=UPI003723D7B9